MSRSLAHCYDDWVREQMDLAWAAGLFEGEGCILVENRAKYVGGKRVRLIIAMKDQDVLERFARIVGAEVKPWNVATRKPEHSMMYRVEIGKKADTYQILKMLRPFFGERRGEKADEAMEFLESVNYDGRINNRRGGHNG